MVIWIYVVVATLLIQIPNIWAITKFDQDPSFKNSMLIAVCCIPTTLLSTACYGYFYALAFQKFSYPIIAMSVYAISLLVAYCVQIFVLKHREVYIADYMALIFIVCGISTLVFREEIQKYF